MNTNMRVLITYGLFAFVGTGCAAPAYSTAIRAPNGEDWVGVDCAGHSEVSCLSEAGNQCPSGYDIKDQEGHFSTQLSSSTVLVGQVGSSATNTQEVHSGSMVIKCRGKSRKQIEAEQGNAPSSQAVVDPWAGYNGSAMP